MCRTFCESVCTPFFTFFTDALLALNGPTIAQGYAGVGTSHKGAMALEEQVLTGLALYWWTVFVLWATRRGWK